MSVQTQQPSVAAIQHANDHANNTETGALVDDANKSK